MASVNVGVFRLKLRRRLANGGLLIAIVGGDGSAEKSTAIDGLCMAGSLQNPPFDAKEIAIGKPVWSWPTIIMWGFKDCQAFWRLIPLQ